MDHAGPATAPAAWSTRSPAAGAIDLYWIPLGAGGHVVRHNGRAYEAIAALIGRRPRRDLYHAALEVTGTDGRYAIEMTPIPDRRGPADRGVTVEGPVGSRALGRLRLFRYEIRLWRDGAIPDADFAPLGPLRLAADPDRARRLVDLVPRVPPLVWGRDEEHLGEMWNSNSVTAWLLAGAGFDVDAITLPANGRAPGWQAGWELARREPPAVRTP
jgi:hypothetical protein